MNAISGWCPSAHCISYPQTPVSFLMIRSWTWRPLLQMLGTGEKSTDCPCKSYESIYAQLSLQVRIGRES